MYKTTLSGIFVKDKSAVVVFSLRTSSAIQGVECLDPSHDRPKLFQQYVNVKGSRYIILPTF